MSGFPTLLYKEVLRFWKVSTQTIGAPVLTAVLFLLIFSHVMQGRIRMYDAVPYAAFLVPGLVMMSVLQNAFANSSSSLVQSKMTCNIIFVLLPPLAYWQFFSAYVLAAAARGMVVGAAVLRVTLPFVEIEFRHPLWRSEERRVGKEGRTRWSRRQYKNKWKQTSKDEDTYHG